CPGERSSEELLLGIAGLGADRLGSVDHEEHGAGGDGALEVRPGGGDHEERGGDRPCQDSPTVLAGRDGALAPDGDEPDHRDDDRNGDACPGAVEPHAVTSLLRIPGRWCPIHHSIVIRARAAATIHGDHSRMRKPSSAAAPGAGATSIRRLGPDDSDGTKRRTATSPGATSPVSST